MAHFDAVGGGIHPINKNNYEANVPTAIAECNKGNPAAGIPVLEKALTDAKVTLPTRN